MESTKNMGVHHPHDKGYKELYSNKEVFLDLLHNILRLDWAEDVKPEDLTLVNKSYVAADYSEMESDLVYRMRLDGKDTIVYVLMEMQSAVDCRMPVRLLFYINEMLREHMKEKAFSASDTEIWIPAVLPIVLYNGLNQWGASLTLRGITRGGETFAENLVDLRYCLIDVNHQYTEEELLGNDCISSAILLLDRKGDMMELLSRLREIVTRFQSLAEGKNRQIITHWLSRTANPLIAESAVRILSEENKEEAKAMIDHMALAYETGMREARQEGRQEGRQEAEREFSRKLARKLRESGMSDNKIAEMLEITKEDVWKLFQ